MQSALSTLKEKGGLNERAVTSFAECQRLVDKQAFDRTYRCSDRRENRPGRGCRAAGSCVGCDRERRAPHSRDTQIPWPHAGLRQGYIADIEAGKKTGSATSLKAIAAALGVPLDVIVG